MRDKRSAVSETSHRRVMANPARLQEYFGEDISIWLNNADCIAKRSQDRYHDLKHQSAIIWGVLRNGLNRVKSSPLALHRHREVIDSNKQMLLCSQRALQRAFLDKVHPLIESKSQN